jgi:hypothetical protein
LSTPWLTSEEFQEVKRFDIHKDDSLPFELQFAADAAAIEARVEKVRARLAPAPEDGVYKTPDEMVDDLEWAKYGTGQIEQTGSMTQTQASLVRAQMALAGSGRDS